MQGFDYDILCNGTPVAVGFDLLSRTPREVFNGIAFRYGFKRREHARTI